MILHNVISYCFIILLSLTNTSLGVQNKTSTQQIQISTSIPQQEFEENVYKFDVGYDGYEGTEIAKAREIVWEHYTKHVPTKVIMTCLTKEGKPVFQTLTIKASENSEWIIVSETGDIKGNYKQQDQHIYEVRSTIVYDVINPIKPPKLGSSSRKLIPKDNLPKPQKYRILLKSTKAGYEIIL